MKRIALAAMVGLLLKSGVVRAQSYTATDLARLEFAMAMNDSGQIAGDIYMPVGNYMAFIAGSNGQGIPIFQPQTFPLLVLGVDFHRILSQVFH